MGIIKDRILAKAGTRLTGPGRIRRGLWTGTDAAQKEAEKYYTNIEVGSIGGSDGLNVDSTSRARTVDYIPIDSFVRIDVPASLTYAYFAFLYKADKTSFKRIPLTWAADSLTKDTISTDYPEYAFIRFIFRTGANSPNITSDDIENLKTMITVA